MNLLSPQLLADIEAQLPVFVLLPETNLGEVYRGDTITLPIWEARDQSGVLLDLTGATVWATFKTDLADPDDAPDAIQCSTLVGGVAILDPVNGMYQVTIPPSATQALADDTVYTFDAQVRTTTPITATVRRGILTVVRDVTRASA